MFAKAKQTAQTPGGEQNRRKLVTFDNELDRSLGGETVRVDSIVADRSAFQRRYEPGHPAADEEGYVLTPNVNSLMEMADLREAQRSYEANRSEEHTSELQSLMRISYAVFCLKKKKKKTTKQQNTKTITNHKN